MNIEKTNGIVFQQKLGTVRARADRLAELAAKVAASTGADAAEQDLARKAAFLCKADLSTGLVSELPSLQGIVGGEYARREKMPEEVCWAIETHYDLSRNPKIDTSSARTAIRVLIADQLDKMAGYLGLGLVPSGSSDPFGLRRSATLLIEAALAWPDVFLGYGTLLTEAASLYGRDDFSQEAVHSLLGEIFRSRYGQLLPARHDLVEATFGSDDLNPQSIRFKTEVLTKFLTDSPFIHTATRPLNIVSAATKKNEPIDSELKGMEGLQSKDGESLATTLRTLLPVIQEASDVADVEKLCQALKGLEGPINAFFDSAMVMDPDPLVRRSRLTLLSQVGSALNHAGDFTKIVLEG